MVSVLVLRRWFWLFCENYLKYVLRNLKSEAVLCSGSGFGSGSCEKMRIIYRIIEFEIGFVDFRTGTKILFELRFWLGFMVLVLRRWFWLFCENY